MNPADILPPLRRFEVIPINSDGQEAFLLRDPQNFAESVITVSRPVLFCLQYFDGKTQAATLAELWKEATNGHEFPYEQLDNIIVEMDRVYLLANDRAAAREGELRQEFAMLVTRPDRFGDAGADILAALARSYQSAGLPAAPQIANESNDLALLIAPHIDYARGGAAWAQAYAAARRGFAGDTVVILGVNHQLHEHPLTLTRKSFATPLGEVRTDSALVGELAAALPFDAFADEFCHRDEHSVELAAIALQHAFGDRCPAIVPILCGSVEDFVQAGLFPRAADQIVAFHEALSAMLARLGDRALVIASVDFSHIGPQFGDETPIDEDAFAASLAADGKLMEVIGRGDAQEFFRAIVNDKNARHLCGVAPLYHALTCVRAGEPLPAVSHGWRAADGAGAVTFAVGGLRRKSVA